jgi:long-chain fatty acid transport protein
VKLDSLDDFQASGRVGFLLHPSDDLALSVFYNSKTDFELKGSFHGPATLTRDLDLNLPLAQFVEVNAYWQVTDRLALLGIFNWEDWSEADSLKVTLGGVTTNATVGFKDTYKIGIGANYRIAEGYLLQTGLTYDTSGLQNKNRTTALPVDEQIRFALGVQHDVSDSLSLGFSFVYINLGQGEVRSASVQGDYKNNNAFVFGLSLAFKSLPWSGRMTFPSEGSQVAKAGHTTQ